MSPRENDYHVLADGTRLPRVTAILKLDFPFANLDWASDLARDNTRRFAAQAYDDAHPVIEGKQFCVGLDTESFMNVIEREQGNMRGGAHKLGQDAAEVGTAAHKYAEAIMRIRAGENVRVPKVTDPRVQNAVDSFHAWLDKHNVRAATAETRLVSRKYGYTGTTDLIGFVDDVFSVVDFKTAKGIFIEYPPQIAAYSKAAVEMGLAQEPVQGMIARFPKEAGDDFEVATYSWEEIEAVLWPAFQRSLAKWQYKEWFDARHPYKRKAPR